jgi:hypothetical protein
MIFWTILVVFQDISDHTGFNVMLLKYLQ